MEKIWEFIPMWANKSRLWLLAVCYCWLSLALGGCKDDNESGSSYDPNLPVTVTKVFPDSGRIIDPIIIYGNNFGTDKSKVKVFFDNKEAALLTTENDHLYVLNPKQKAGKHTVKVIVDGKEAIAPHAFKYLISSSVYTVAGDGEYDQVDGNAMEASFGEPSFLCIDDQGNLIVVDYNDHVRLVSISERKVRTIFQADDLYGCCFSPDYNIFYVGVEGQRRVGYCLMRNVNWSSESMVNDGSLNYTCALATLEDGEIIALSCVNTLARLDKQSHEIKVFGELNEDLAGYNNDYYMAYNPHDKMMYVSSTETHVIFRFDPSKESLTDSDFELYAGKLGRTGYVDGSLENASFNQPCGMDFDEDGNMLVADRGNHVIRMVTPDGMVSTFAGSERGDADGKPEEAKFYGPADVTVAPDGLVYVSEAYGRKIRCIAIQ